MVGLAKFLFENKCTFNETKALLAYLTIIRNQRLRNYLRDWSKDKK